MEIETAQGRRVVVRVSGNSVSEGTSAATVSRFLKAGAGNFQELQVKTGACVREAGDNEGTIEVRCWKLT